ARPNQQVSDSITSEPTSAANADAAKQPAVGTLATNTKPTNAESPTSTAAAPRKREGETEAMGSPGTRTARAPAAVGGAVDQLQKSDAKSTSSTADEAQRKARSELASQAPVQSGAASSQGAKKVDSEESREQQKQEKEAAQQAPESKPGRVDEPRDKEKAAKVAEVAPPPAPAAPASSSERIRSNGGLRRSAPKLSLRDSAGSSDSVRPNVKRINNKDFFFRDNTWTDKEFDPNKDLPVVTIIRDSNVYKELLAKRANLRPYLEGFPENQRAIIVFKG